MPDFQKIDPKSSYTLSEAAALKGVSYQSALYAVHNGTLRATRERSRFLVTGSALLNWHPGRQTRRKPASPGREF